MVNDLEVEALHARMLRKPLWVVLSRPAAEPEVLNAHRKAHLEHQIALEKSGVLFGAGPATVPGETTPAFGLIVIRAADESEARRIADSDPMHSSGARRYELYRWSMNEGRLGITIDLSDRSYRFD